MTIPRMDEERFRGYRTSSPRLAAGDYAAPGWFFITIRTRRGRHWFGEVIDGEMNLSPAGSVAQQCLTELPTRFQGLELGASVVMPNHVHLLFAIAHSDSDPAEPRPSTPRRFGALHPGSASSVVNHYKGRVTRALRSRGFREFAWQRLYHDRIVRTERELKAVHDYIVMNPQRWRHPW